VGDASGQWLNDAVGYDTSVQRATGYPAGDLIWINANFRQMLHIQICSKRQMARQTRLFFQHKSEVQIRGA
jgi:murein endopeptidase